ncbi:MAG: D-alanyl-D-alanine carboxypeptidase [Bacilli bacterium]|nr:D-alanyl-D-alanine carboxypeptidase [Bacilli bacterium]
MKKILFIIIILLCPIRVFAEELIPNSTSGILIEANSGKIIFEKEINKEVSVASMTKMVAQIIILEEIKAKHIKWDDIATVSKNASDMGGSQIYLEQGEKITLEDLMKGISVASGNDATVAMAEYISGSEEKFVKRMNKKVKELGLVHTHFTNCTGLDEKNHYSSAYDMAMIARELVVNYPEILKFSSIYEDYLRENTNKKFWLVNTNKLIAGYEGTDGLKTGHTDDAGYCLAATTKRNNVRLIAIVLGEKESKIRNKETMELLDYGFNNIKVKTLKKKGVLIDRRIVNKADKNYVDIILKEDLNVVEDLEDNNKYKYEIEIDNINVPLSANTPIGEIIVKNNSKVIAKEELITAFDLNKVPLLTYYLNNLKNIIIGNY